MSAKLKLQHNAEQKAALDAISLAYRDALNYASEEAFKLDKTSSAPKLHKVIYNALRENLVWGRNWLALLKGKWQVVIKPSGRN